MMSKSGIHFTFPAALAASWTYSVNGRLSRGLFRNRHYPIILLPSSNDYISDDNLLPLLSFFSFFAVSPGRNRRIVAYPSTLAPIFSPRVLIAFGHETWPDSGQC